MSNSFESYSMENLPSEVTLLPMSHPGDVLEKTGEEYSRTDDHVYTSEDGDIVLADIYGSGQTIDRMKDAIDGGAETFNLVGLCVAQEDPYSAGEIVEPHEIHGIDLYSTSVEPSYVREPDEFPVQDMIDHSTRHASVPAVHYDGSPYFSANGIETGDMETAAAIMASEGDERTDIDQESVSNVSVRAALSVFDTFDDGISQEEVWNDSDISKAEAYRKATASAAELVDELSTM